MYVKDKNCIHGRRLKNIVFYTLLVVKQLLNGRKNGKKTKQQNNVQVVIYTKGIKLVQAYIIYSLYYTHTLLKHNVHTNLITHLQRIIVNRMRKKIKFHYLYEM